MSVTLAVKYPSLRDVPEIRTYNAEVDSLLGKSLREN